MVKGSAKKVLVSACLTGEPCRYDGTASSCAGIAELAKIAELVLACPEVAGGLPVPREPCEIREGRVVSRSGADMTGAYQRGADEAVRWARESGCRFALLKEKSPSCGFGAVYDGTFSGALVAGDGFAAAALAKADIEVFGESQIEVLCERLSSLD